MTFRQGIHHARVLQIVESEDEKRFRLEHEVKSVEEERANEKAAETERQKQVRVLQARNTNLVKKLERTESLEQRRSDDMQSTLNLAGKKVERLLKQTSVLKQHLKESNENLKVGQWFLGSSNLTYPCLICVPLLFFFFLTFISNVMSMSVPQCGV
jgi:hypothetical protein